MTETATVEYGVRCTSPFYEQSCKTLESAERLASVMPTAANPHIVQRIVTAWKPVSAPFIPGGQRDNE